MNKIQRVSKCFGLFFQLLFVGLPLLLAIGWMSSPESFVTAGGIINMNFIPRSYVGKILHVLSDSDRLLGFCLNMIPLSIQLYILYSLIKLFKLYEQGDIFSLQNVRHIRNIGYALFITQLINPFYEGLMGVVLTRHNPPGQRFAAITFDHTNLAVIAIAFMVILISWIMAEGCKLREEQQLTI